MKKNILAGGALLAALALVATGCAGSSGGSADAGDGSVAMDPSQSASRRPVRNRGGAAPTPSR